jgi:hypothetical protein
MTRISTKDWRNLPIEQWNITTFHAMAIDLTRERFGVDYQPGGPGAMTTKWSREKGMLKTEQGRYGNEVLRKFIEYNIENYRPTIEYPFINVWFMMTYRKVDFAKVQVIVAQETKFTRSQTQASEIEDDWI